LATKESISRSRSSTVRQRKRVADLKTFRSRSAAHAVLFNRVKNSVAQVLRIGFRHRLLASAQPTG
jgi:hypothetical protein